MFICFASVRLPGHGWRTLILPTKARTTVNPTEKPGMDTTAAAGTTHAEAEVAAKGDIGAAAMLNGVLAAADQPAAVAAGAAAAAAAAATADATAEATGIELAGAHIAMTDVAARVAAMIDVAAATAAAAKSAKHHHRSRTGIYTMCLAFMVLKGGCGLHLIEIPKAMRSAG
jgi:hypothetical protein